MLRAVVVLVLVLAAACTGLVAAAGAGADAPLHVTLAGGRPQVRHARSYPAAQPIAVRVDGQKTRGALSVVGLSPAGENLRVPLLRGPGGDYAGTIVLPTPGVWSLAIAGDGAATGTAAFPLAVAAQAPVWGVMTSLLLCILCIAAGIALIAYGMRERRSRPTA